MKTVVYLSSRAVEAVTGEVKRGAVRVTGVFREEVPGLSIVNGQATDDEEFTRFLKGFWKKHNLPGNNVYLVVGSTQTVIRFFELPPMSHGKMMGYLPREFSDVERMREPVYGYGVLGNGKSDPMLKMFGVMMERKFLKGHMDRFRSLGIRIVSVEAELMAKLRFLNALEYLQGKTCGVVLADQAMVLSVLWVGRTFLHFNRRRIPASNNPEAAAGICAREIGSVIQFASSWHLDEEIREVYVGGLDDEEFACCEKICFRENSGLTVRHLADGAGSGIDFPGGACEFGRFGAAVGGLFASRGKENLLHQYGRPPELSRKRKEAAKLFAPAFVTAAVLSLILFGQAVNWWRLAGRTDQCLDRLSDPQVLAGKARYDRMAAENIALRKEIEALEGIKEELERYPVMDTRIQRAVERCAAGLVEAEVTGFQAEQGVVQVSSRSEEESAIHSFVENLAGETEIFSGIDYTGFEYAETEQVWKLYVECYLNTRKGEEGPR